MLKRMLRRYTAQDYVARVSELKARVPGLTLSSDVIVGFPGETEADFASTLELVQAAGFVSVFGFKYSPRPHTPALRLEDDVPESVKDERLQRLFALVDGQQRAHLASLVGQRVEVLIESRDEQRPERFTGRSERNELVHVDVPAGQDPRGQMLSAEVIEAFKHSLHGVALGAIPQPELTGAASPAASVRKPLRLPLASA
jgi:tRNA-2-methylthio-N6-dimethylallyladenosine synthase